LSREIKQHHGRNKGGEKKKKKKKKKPEFCEIGQTNGVDALSPVLFGGQNQFQSKKKITAAGCETQHKSSSKKKKKKKMSDPTTLERLEENNARRREERAERDADRAVLRDPDENPAAFLTRTRETGAAVDEHIARARAAAAANNAAEVTSVLDGALELCRAFTALAARSAHYLPPYDLRQAQEASRSMEARVVEAKQKLAPRKKFAFSARKKPAAPAAQPAPPAPSANTGANDADGKVNNANDANDAQNANDADAPNANDAKVNNANDSDAASKNPDAVATAPAPPAPSGEAAPGGTARTELRGHSAPAGGPPLQLVRDAQGCDTDLTALSNCHVLVTGTPGALRLRDLAHCTVVCRAVDGPVFMEDCTDCTVYARCRQVRIHGTHRTDCYLAVRSGPIIEHCSGMRFAPLLAPAADGPPNGPWDAVEDFRWLKRQRSPNWDILPADARAEPPAIEESRK
jgi:hypothetical protein